MGKTYIFFHVYCNKNTHRIFSDMISKIIYSDLYNYVDKIFNNPVCDIVFSGS